MIVCYSDKNSWDEKIEKLLEKMPAVGLSVAVTDRKGLIYKRGFGSDSIERPEICASPESMYRIASISKMITGITVLRLAEGGRLELDRPVKDYVPWLRLQRPEALRQMTLRHLLSHTSGLPAEYTPIGPRDESFLERSLMDGLPDAPMATLPADGVFLYSNWGVRLASYVAQRVTGKRFSALAEELVIRPLAMERTTYDLCVAATYPLSLPHAVSTDGTPHVEHLIKENAARYAAGGLYSNVVDLCRLARFLLSDGLTDAGERLLSEKSMAEMRRIHANVDMPDCTWYGLTMQQYASSRLGRVLYGHMGDNSPYLGSLWVEPQSGFGVVTELNTPYPALRILIAEELFANMLRLDPAF